MDSFEINTGGYDLSSLREEKRNSAPSTTEPITMDDSAANQPRQAARKTVATKTVTSPTREEKNQTPEEPSVNKNNNFEETKQKVATEIVRFFADGRFRIFSGILLILLSAVLLVATISYASKHISDQSIVLNHTAEEIANNHDGVQNAVGWVGSMLSGYLFKLFGISSYIIIFYVGALGVSLVHLYRFKFWQLTFKCLFSTCAVSIIVGFATYWSISASYWGGIHGYHVNDILMKSTEIWGTGAVSILLLSALILIFLTPIKNFLTQIHKLIKSRKDALAKRYNETMLASQSEKEIKPIEATVEMVQQTQTPEPAPTEPVAETTLQPLEEIETPVIEKPQHFDDEPKRDTISVVEEVSEPTLFDDLEEIETITIEEDNDKTEENEIENLEVIVEQPQIEETEEIDIDAYDPTAELSHYRFPDIELLTQRTSTISVDDEEREENQQLIINSLRNYGIEISQIKATVGPTITLYEIIPAPGVRIATIRRLADDMALSLSAIGIRIIAPIPGKGTIGMEVPNKNPQTVSIRSILSSKAYHESTAELPVALGTTISNDVYVTDLAKMPHLLVAGATGMGKSVGLNTIIASLLYKKHPAELKFVLVDPKMVEFSLYKCLERHFLAKLPEEDNAIITDPNKVVATLNSLCVEMDNRYELLSMAGMRGIKEYNQKFISRRLNPEKGHRYLPYIVVIIDEFADLILTAGRDVETPISRIAAKARAVGIHMILATQRPSVNVITGTIKANFPARMAFRVTQMNDSRTILDRPGAEQLVGRGDMLMSRDGTINRVQCAFIDTDEVERICKSISDQMGYMNAYELPEMPVAGGEGGGFGAVGDRDPLFAEAGRLVISSNMGSATSIQRKLNVGYPRAGKLIDQLEAAGVVGAATGAGKPRPVLMDLYAFENLLEQS